MKCPIENREEELLLNYVSGALDAENAALFEKHTLHCAACAKFVRGQRAVWGALDLFEPAQISADFNRRLYQRIDQVSTHASWWDRSVLWDRLVAAFRSPLLAHRGLPLAAGVALLAVVGILWERPASPPAKPQTPLSAEVETIQPDQVQHALDDLEMLREFNHLMRPGPAESKM